jgi:hypothetical protein
MIFFLGKNKKILISFATRLADEFYSQVPLELLQGHLEGGNKKASKRYQATLENTLVQLAQFKASMKPGIYGKAKLHQVFLERLKELGYPAEAADEINKYLLLRTP